MPAKSKIYSVICTKGGVGKTTIAANIGAILADMGQRVLLVDADPQQSLSRVCPIETQADFGLIQVYRSASTAGCISKTNIPNLDIILNDDPHGEHIVAFLRESYVNFQHLYVALVRLIVRLAHSPLKIPPLMSSRRVSMRVILLSRKSNPIATFLVAVWLLRFAQH